LIEFDKVSKLSIGDSITLVNRTPTNTAPLLTLKFLTSHPANMGINFSPICHWSFVIGHLSLVIGHWSFVISHWSLVIGH
jgi:hypothetical protein